MSDQNFALVDKTGWNKLTPKVNDFFACNITKQKDGLVTIFKRALPVASGQKTSFITVTLDEDNLIKRLTSLQLRLANFNQDGNSWDKAVLERQADFAQKVFTTVKAVQSGAINLAESEDQPAVLTLLA